MRKIRDLHIDFPEELIPDNVEVLIERLYDADNRKVGRLARKEEDRGEFSYGLIKAVKEAIQQRNRLDNTTTSTQDARIDRILFTTDSDGRRKSRKWN
ncbi:hypothetical protein [Tepidanaerobacter syntrophicus]|uniref:hypothetical protein n=1 Tax=Tepidanaerobacter syntrophicus TaxID=224999 RepID=UPI001BD4799F|nr:hypothetical protein [Tepidanaerobacter syntrophicus]